MEEVMSIKDSLLGTIMDFIAQRKVAKLEKAFRNNKEIVDAIQKMNTSYKAINDRLENFCKKNPEICKEAEETRNKFL